MRATKIFFLLISSLSALAQRGAVEVETLKVGTTITYPGGVTTLGISGGGTGQTSASAAFNALAPSKTGNGNKYLRVNAGETDYELVTLSGGGDALTSNPLSQFASTTSAQLAGVISNETGTGVVVLDASPALTGTPTAPSAALNTNSTQLATTAYVDTKVRTLALTSNASANSTTGMVEVTGLNLTVGAGTYAFEYYIRAQSSSATVSLKFAVNHTGTVTTFTYHLYFPSQGVTAATGVVDQELNATTGNVWAVSSTRAKNTTLGPNTDVDTINADILYRISGLMIVTVSGDLELYHGSETATSTQVMAGSGLVLTKLAD